MEQRFSESRGFLVDITVEDVYVEGRWILPTEGEDLRLSCKSHRKNNVKSNRWYFQPTYEYIFSVPYLFSSFSPLPSFKSLSTRRHTFIVNGQTFRTETKTQHIKPESGVRWTIRAVENTRHGEEDTGSTKESWYGRLVNTVNKCIYIGTTVHSSGH